MIETTGGVTADQLTVFGILGVCLALFIWGRPRYDLVALLSLLATVIFGFVSPDEALLGFGHPAVITVAAVLIISGALRNAGLVDMVARMLGPYTRNPTLHVGALTLVVTALSAFMNNVGALAIMLPIALATAAQNKRSPSIVLMPIAFGSVLGGIITLMGTPPNIIVAAFRAEVTGRSFAMFDYAPVGLPTALAGVLFIALIGWRLLPKERRGTQDTSRLYEISDYLIEVKVTDKSPVIGMRLAVFEDLAGEAITAVGLVHGEDRLLHPSPWHTLEIGDILILRADPGSLTNFIEKQKLELLTHNETAESIQSDTVGLVEAVIPPQSKLLGRGAEYLEFITQRALNLIALSRQGTPIHSRLKDVTFEAGDVVLVQAERNSLGLTLTEAGLLPLAERNLTLGSTRAVWKAVLIFAVAIVINLMGWLPLAYAFIGAVIAYVVVGIMPVRDLYRDVDWSVIVLLGAMFPISKALETTGGANLIAGFIVAHAGELHPAILIAMLMFMTMCLSDLLNNAATVLIMCPIGIAIAQYLNANPDTFLMAIAVAASCSFLTPISHQSSTLVMGPGGYRFSDYWRMGLPLEMVILAVATPLLLYFWPIYG